MIVILKWSEVWSTLIPLYIFIIKRSDDKSLNIIAVYLLTALCLNTAADVSWIFKPCIPLEWQNNNFIYNISSILRMLVFIFFFRNIVRLFPKKYFDIFLLLYILFFTSYFIIEKNFRTLNSLLHTIEGLTLIVCSIIFLIRLIRSNRIFVRFDPYILIVSGLVLYESVNFFVFLFYQYLLNITDPLLDNIWYVADIMFVIFCVFIAVAFYGQSKVKI